ncbi:T9SS type A sorting domain-containing protein [Aureisphaera sp.]
MKTLLLTTVLFALTFNALAQEWVRGKVTDSFDKKGLTDANIVNLKTKKGVVSDKEGSFRIEVTKGDILEVSYVGFKSKIVVVEDNKPVDVSLEVDTLDEVLVLAEAAKWEKVHVACMFISCSLESSNEESEDIDLQNNISSLNSQQVRLFPNPSSGIFHIGFVKEYRTVNVHVHNILGQQIHSSEFKNFGKEVKVNLSAQPTGIYLVNVLADGEKLKTHKLIKS